jgi:transposase
MRSRRDLLDQALQGLLKSHHRFLLAEQLADSGTPLRGHRTHEWGIAERLQPYEQQILRLSTIPGIKRRLAEVILAEIAPDMCRFPSARQLASWAGMCSGKHESAGKCERRQDAQGQSPSCALPWSRLRMLPFTLQTAPSRRETHRLVVRWGGKKATIDVGHSLVVILYHVLAEEKGYQEWGGKYFDDWDRLAVQKRLVRR